MNKTSAETWKLRGIPLAPFALAVCGGVTAALYLDMASEVLFLVCIIIAVLTALLGLLRRGTWLLVGLLCLFFAALGSYRATIAISRDVRREISAVAATCDSIHVYGRVLFPVQGMGSSRSIVLYPASLQYGGKSLDCKALSVRLFSDSTALNPYRYGDFLLAWGTLRASAPETAGSSGALAGILTRREAGIVFCKADAVLGSIACGFSWRRWIDELRSYIVVTFEKNLTPDAASLGKALVLGDRRDFAPAFSDRLRLTGLSHLFALSGMNVGFLLAIVWGITGLLCVPRIARLFLLLPAVLLYMELGREAPSLVRASIMAAFFVAANLLYRRNDILNMVAGAVLLELLWRPLDLLDAGFLLSYLAVIGILGEYGFIRERLLIGVGQARSMWIRGTVNLAAATTGAQIGTLPLVAFLFHRAPLLGALGNLIAVPGFAVLLLWSVVLLFVESAAPSLSGMVSASMNALSFVLAKSVEFFSVLPLASLMVPDFSPIFLVLLYGFVGWIMAGAVLRRLRWMVGGALMAGTFAVWGAFIGSLDHRPELSFISVGHGDAILFSEGEHSVLIDSGPSFGDWSAADRILAYLEDRGIRRLDAMILTHADNDHMGGAAEILARIPVAAIYSNGDSGDTHTLLHTRMASQARGVPWKTLTAGDRLILANGVSLTTLSPDAGLKDDASSSNRRSLVFKLECSDASALLAADIDSLTEKDLLLWGNTLDVDLLKVAHHGSKSSSCAAFLTVVSPRISIISTSTTNRFHHPDSSVVARLQSVGSAIYSTAASGSLRFVCRSGRWEFEESRAQRFSRLWKLRNA